jgi:hypothetical protein
MFCLDTLDLAASKDTQCQQSNELAAIRPCCSNGCILWVATCCSTAHRALAQIQHLLSRTLTLLMDANPHMLPFW